MATRLKSKRFHSPEADLAYVEGPANGRLPVMLLHGMASRWQPFQPLIPAIAEQYHVYALDLRGHGLSSHTPGAYRLGDYTRDLHPFITRIVQSPAAVYGHSLGALVGISLAAQHPTEVRALILGDPPLFHHNTPIQDTVWHAAFKDLLAFQRAHPDPVEMDAFLAEHFPNMAPERREERVRSLETLDPDALRFAISDELMAGVSLRELAAKVTCPVLLLRGNPSLGSALREQDVEFAVRTFPEIRVLEMETVGHAILPVELLPQVTAFIDGLAKDGNPGI